MNHRELLKKFINHVVSEEGISFIDSWFPGSCDHACRERMSDEEWAELRAIDAEVTTERKAARAKWDAEWSAAHPPLPLCKCIRRPEPINNICVTCAKAIKETT